MENIATAFKVCMRTNNKSECCTHNLFRYYVYIFDNIVNEYQGIIKK